MKLMHSGTSPFVRKVMVAAIELGLDGEITKEQAAAHPIDRSGAIRAKNPLGQVPTLVLDDGTALYDSRVICEYLDARAGGSLFGAGEARWRILAEQALADGVMAAGVLCRYEATVRPEDRRWQDWTGGQTAKIVDALDRFEKNLPQAGERLDIGTISIGCALGYLDFRFGDLEWRKGRAGAAAWFERFAARPSMTATAPVG